MQKNVWNIKIYTKTVTEGRDRKMWGVIEAPIDKMLKAELISVKKEKGKSTKVRLLIK